MGKSPKVCKHCGSFISDRSGIQIDDDTCTVYVDGTERYFSPIEYRILKLFVENPGRLYSVREIHALSGIPYGHGTGNTAAAHICNIRRKVGDYAIHIRSKRGFGYKYISPNSLVDKT